jgi:hypothetical protein
MLRVFKTAVVAGALLSFAIPVAPVMAEESGMASMHTWKKVGKKTCMVDHQHSGSGSGINKKAAELQAIRSWSGFTDLEYGSSWANFNIAIEKSVRCSPSIGGVQCDLLATACRPW